MDERFTKGGPLPASVGEMADLYAEVRELRLAMQKAVDEVHARETEIRKAILETLMESPDTGASGERQRVQLVKKTAYPVKDWMTFWPWVAQHQQWQLLGKRASEKALRELHDEYGQLPPGVETAEYEDLSFAKVES